MVEEKEREEDLKKIKPFNKRFKVDNFIWKCNFLSRLSQWTATDLKVLLNDGIKDDEILNVMKKLSGQCESTGGLIQYAGGETSDAGIQWMSRFLQESSTPHE